MVAPFAALALSFVGGCSSSGTTAATGTSGGGGQPATTSSGGATTTTTTGGGGQSGSGGGAVDLGDSVLQHHKSPSRDGVYTQPLITPANAGAMHVDPTFTAVTQGATYAQPLFLDGGPGGKDLVFAATEENWIYALDAATGATVWSKKVGEPVKLSDLPCGNITTLGITGTPVIDGASRTIFADAMTSPDGGGTKKHLIVGLSVDTGESRPGFPIDVSAMAKTPSLAFDSAIENQRGALMIVGGTLYVPYGGHYGDCGAFHGWVVGVPLANPAAVQAWATLGKGGGTWAPGGLSSDGDGVYLATGNTFGAPTWLGGEAIIRLGAGPVFSNTPADYFAPTDWMALDAGDVDIGGSGPVLFDLPGAVPSKLTIALGKNGKAYLLDRTNLGGVSEAVSTATVATNEIINAAAAVRTSTATYVIFNGAGKSCPNGTKGNLVALLIGVGLPPTISTAWCADEHGSGSPMVTTTDGHAGAVVWTMGVQGDGKLHGFDAETGKEIFTGGGSGDAMSGLKRFSTPIAAKGRIFAAGTDAVYAFTVK
jgi:outer membrane protein assembly factor BamB